MRFGQRFLGSLAILWCFSTMAILTIAQDSTPILEPTAIPILPLATQDTSAAPGLPSNVGAPTLPDVQVQTEVTAEPVAESTEEAIATSAPDTSLPASTDVCPTLVQDSFSAVEIVCSGLTSGEGCIGNGTVESVLDAEIAGIQFAAPGDRISLVTLSEISVRTSNTPGNVWSVVTGILDLASLDGSLPTPTTMYLFGDVTLVDTGETASGGAINATVLAQRGMNVRRAPNPNGEVVWQLAGGEQVLATGRTVDQEWIRIVIPNQFQGIGWVYAPYLDVEGGIEALGFVDVNSAPPTLSAPDYAPMQSFELLSADIADDCGANIPDSGLLLQTPSGLPDAARIRINNVRLQVNGTIFVQAQAEQSMRINVLEGQTQIVQGDSIIDVPAGNTWVVTLDSSLQPTNAGEIVPIASAIGDALPTRLLPRQFIMGFAPQDVPEETSAPVQSSVCTLTAPNEVRNMRTGPALVFPVQRVIQANESITATGQAVGEFNYVWYLTSEGGWVRIDSMTADENCTALPTVEAPPIPVTPTPAPALSSSTLGMVTCQADPVNASTTFDGSDFSVALGGTWTVNAGTTVIINTQGGQLRPEFGDYIQVQAEDGTLLASSGEGRELAVLFEQTVTFVIRLSAGNGDLVLLAVRCNS